MTLLLGLHIIPSATTGGQKQGQRDHERGSGTKGQGQRDRNRGTNVFVLFFYAKILKIFSLPVGFYKNLSCYLNILRFTVLLHW